MGFTRLLNKNRKSLSQVSHALKTKTEKHLIKFFMRWTPNWKHFSHFFRTLKIKTRGKKISQIFHVKKSVLNTFFKLKINIRILQHVSSQKGIAIHFKLEKSTTIRRTADRWCLSASYGVKIEVPLQAARTSQQDSRWFFNSPPSYRVNKLEFSN